jgi:hypothetical protein
MKKPERPHHRWEDNIETDLTEIDFEGINWTKLAVERDKWHSLVRRIISI